MAIIKKSNQITFTEQKRIMELKEWYLATSFDNILTDETTPEEATEGQLWFNKYNDNSSKLMQFTNGEWVPYATQFTTEMQSVSSSKKYLWNYEEVVYSIGPSDISDPVIIGMYGTGADGKGITDILNYYGTTQEPELPDPIPDNFWKDNKDAIKELSSVNKYLWNYERVLYTDGTSKPSEPMIIGVYGDSGEDAITFKIYSTDGFEFIDSVDEEEALDSIELKLAAFKGSDQLTEALYTWSYWNTELGAYEDVEGYINTSETSFIVNITDSYALANLKCTMSYNEKTYEDYVVLSSKLDIYSASVKFFNGTNIFSQTQEYLVGYIELYKNNKLEESVVTNNCYIGNSSVDQDTGIITTDYTNNETDDITVYFVCANNDDYEIVLGEYNGTEWHVVNNSTQYIYQNDIDLTATSNVFLISKKDISRARDVNIYIYTKYVEIAEEDGSVTTAIDSTSMVATTHVTITDLNDVISSPNEPTNVYEGQLWLDTANNMLKIYSDGKWVSTAKQQRGQNTYTVKPTYYEIGDLWIVAKEDEIIGFQKANGDTISFTEGSIWTATQNSDELGFNAEHWDDAVPEITKLQSNIAYNFDFNEETGLKIGQKDHRFYVNIKATRMSFCENPEVELSDEDIKAEKEDQEHPDPNEVVHIGNKSATIRGLVVKEGSGEIKKAQIECEAIIDRKIHIANTDETNQDYPGFTWQIEPDGGLSLVKMEVR